MARTADPTRHAPAEFVRAAISERVIAFIPIAKYHAYFNAKYAIGAQSERLETNSSIGVDFNEVAGS